MQSEFSEKEGQMKNLISDNSEIQKFEMQIKQ